MSRRKTWIYAATAIVGVLCCVWILRHIGPAWTKYRVKSRIANIEPWPSSTNYSAAGWQHLIAAARTFQKTDSKLIDAALKEYLQKYAGRPELVSEQSKVFLLLRAVFDLPEDAHGVAEHPFSDWNRGQAGLNAGGTVNLDWPLSWSQGGPRLVAGRDDSGGGHYSAREEYDYLRYHFPFRDFSKIRM